MVNAAALRACHVQPLSEKTFGAVVTGPRLAALHAEEWRDIEMAFNEYGLLIFPKQFLTPDEQGAFAKRFGSLEFGSQIFTNRRKNGDVIDPEAHFMKLSLGNEFWHSDSTYKEVAAKAGMLAASKVPVSGGGETEFADMRAAFDALADTTKERIESMAAYHSTLYSQANDVGHFPPVDENTIYHGNSFLRPLVQAHPVTGRKSLLVGRHAFAIPELPREEARELLAELVDSACQGPRVYTHHWQEGDLVLWDNRCLLHRARPYGYGDETRMMIGSRVAGAPVTDSALQDPMQRGRKALEEEMALQHARWQITGSPTSSPKLLPPAQRLRSML